MGSPFSEATMREWAKRVIESNGATCGLCPPPHDEWCWLSYKNNGKGIGCSSLTNLGFDKGVVKLMQAILENKLVLHNGKLAELVD